MICCLVAPTIAMGQPAIGLTEALELAREGNLQLQQQQLSQRIAELEVAVNNGQRLPAASFGALSFLLGDITSLSLPTPVPGISAPEIKLGGNHITSLNLFVTQPLYTGGRLRNQVKLARTALELEQTRRQLLGQQVAYQVHLLMYQAQILKKERGSKEASLKRLQVQLTRSKSLLRAAQSTPLDTLRFYNQGLQIKLELERLAKEEKLLSWQLAHLLDLETPRAIAAIQFAEPSPPSESLEDLVAVAWQKRPELQVIRLRVQAADLKRRLAQGAYWPAISAQVGYVVVRPELELSNDAWWNFPVAGLNLQWNLWRGNQDRNRVRQAEAEREQLTLEEQELLSTVSLDIKNSMENLDFAYQQIGLARELLAQQQESFRIATLQREQGLTTASEVIEVETALTTAELQMQRAVVGYYVARAELLLATGRIDQ